MAAEGRHILGSFENALHQLKRDITTMAAASAQNVTHAVRGLIDRRDELCNQAIADDTDVDRLEKKIDQEGMEIIMKFSPVAADLRRVISTMKMSASLERVSDHAVSIARRARKTIKERALPETEMLEPIYDKAINLLNDAVRSFLEGELDLALQLEERDHSLDESHHALLKRLTQRMEEDTPRIRDYVDLIFITRYLERIGDQACNIAEDAVYLISAFDIRHGGERPVG
jgi:phosphate transport system protein